MRHYYCYLFLLLAISLTLISCSHGDNIPEYESKVLNEILDRAPIKRIDLDTVPVSVITPDSNNIFGKEDPSIDSLLLGVIGNAISIDNKVYILDRSQNSIITTSKDGFIVSKIYNPGRGPGEFGQIEKIFSNKHGIYLYDRKNSKVHLYDKNWNLIKSKTLKNSLGKKTYEASNKYLFLPDEVNSPNIVQIVSPTPPFKRYYSLLPRLIPFGMQPFAYNNVRIKGNNNIIVAAYIGLPFIFIFNNEFNHLKTLYFTSKKISSIQSPPLTPKPEMPGSGVGVPTIFMGFEVLENNDLIISLGKEIYYLNANSNLDYELISANYLHYSNKEKQKKDGYGISASYIDQDGDYILVSSITEDRAYKFHIENFEKN